MANRAILDETAFFFETTKLDPLPFFSLPRSTRKPLHIIVEEAIALQGRAEFLESAYNESMRLLLSDRVTSGFDVDIKEEVKLEPDGVPSQTGTRAARAQASGKQARQQIIEEARAEIFQAFSRSGCSRVAIWP